MRGPVPPKVPLCYDVVQLWPDAEIKECSSMSEYKICRRCGAQLDPDDNFCMACGAPTSEDFLVAGSDLSGMPVGQVAPEAPSPEATVPVPAVLDVVDESEGVVRSDGPATTWGGVDTAAIHEPVTSSALPAMDWGPSPEPSGVAPSGGNVDAPSEIGRAHV